MKTAWQGLLTVLHVLVLMISIFIVSHSCMVVHEVINQAEAK